MEETIFRHRADDEGMCPFRHIPNRNTAKQVLYRPDREGDVPWVSSDMPSVRRRR